MTKYTTEQIDSNNICFHFTIPYSEFEAMLDAVYRSNKGKYDMPGVRKGNASRKMLEARFGKTVFAKPAVDKLVSEAYCKAASEYPEEIYYTPSVTIEKNNTGNNLVFSARVKIKPEVILCDYRSVMLTEEDLKKVENAALEIPESERENTRQYLLQSALIGHIADESTLEIPTTMINERALSMAREFERRLAMNQESLEEYYKDSGTDEKAMLEGFAEAAGKQLRSRLTLLAIAQAEELEANDEEYNAEIQRLSSAYFMPLEQLKGLFASREGSKIKQDIGIAKAADFIGKMVLQQIHNDVV